MNSSNAFKYFKTLLTQQMWNKLDNNSHLILAGFKQSGWYLEQMHINTPTVQLVNMIYNYN